MIYVRKLFLIQVKDINSPIYASIIVYTESKEWATSHFIRLRNLPFALQYIMY